MQPGDGFWDGLGQGFASSPGWMIVGALLVIGVLFIVAKYVVPSRERIKTRELDIREREQTNDAERIKVNAQLAENQRQGNVIMDGVRASIDASNARIDILVTEIASSRDGSRKMGGQMDHVATASDHISETVDDTNDKVTDIHAKTNDIYNMLNRRGITCSTNS